MKHSKQTLTFHIPSGKHTSNKIMRDFGRKLRNFVRETEAQLQQEKNVQRYNDTVDYLNRLAQNFNKELKAFKQAQQERQLESLGVFMHQKP